jgi:aspartate/methionine/tyrosine aminotransferase
LSRTAGRLVADSPAIADAHFMAEADAYHPERNPAGYVNLGTAENRLMWDMLAPRLRAPRRVTAEDTRYAPLHGTAALRAAIAGFLSRCWHSEVNPEHLVVVSGATAALDIIASVLCEPGQAIAAPAPYYAAFATDLCGRSGACLIGVPSAASGGFRLDPASLDGTLTDFRRSGQGIRAVAVTSPGNPVGHVYSPATLRALAEVVRQHDADLIRDEIYAHSVFGTERFAGIRDPLVGATHSGRTHVIWGFAKDFALPGLKAGVLHTTCPQIGAAARALAYFAPLSADTQHLLCTLLADPAWTDAFIAENRRRLGASYANAARQLAEHNIPHIEVSAGFSLWADLRAWLPTSTFAAEEALWRRILRDARVNILPGGEFGCAQPGWFRLCHATDPALVREGVGRIGRLLTPAGRGSGHE